MRPFARGAFSEVFDLGDGRILKAFIEIRPNTCSTADPRLIPQMQFSAELRAYEAVQECPELEVFTPRFFGRADPSTYSLESEETFPCGCGLILEKIPGSPVKLAHLDAPIQQRAEEVIEEIREHVYLEDPWDGSCFVPGTREDFTLIDFASLSDRLLHLEEVLEKYGGEVPDDLHGRWGIFLD